MGEEIKYTAAVITVSDKVQPGASVRTRAARP